MKKVKIGDIFEINTTKGRAYLHYIYKDKAIGELVRILPGLYVDRPVNFDELASSKEKYMIYFPLGAANRQKIVEQVGYHSADKFEKPQHMRTEHIIQGEFLGWHIIDTDTWQRQLVKTLSSKQKQLSSWGIWNDTLLIEKLLEDWTLEKWC